MERLVETICTLVSIAEEQLPREHFEELDNDGATIIGYLEELKMYRDLEAQGLLLKLPCNVGDTVYCLKYNNGVWEGIEPHTIKTLLYIVQLVENGFIGDLVFLTKEEAEVKLKELQNE